MHHIYIDDSRVQERVSAVIETCDEGAVSEDEDSVLAKLHHELQGH